MSENKKMSREQIVDVMSIYGNGFIVILVALGLTISLIGKGFFETFKYYTTLSNLVCAISSIIMIVYASIAYKKNTLVESKFANIARLIGTFGVALTGITVLVFIGPVTGFATSYSRHNLIFHLVVPLLSIILYVFVENNQKHPWYIFTFPLIGYAAYAITYWILLFNWDMWSDFYGFLTVNPLFSVGGLSLGAILIAFLLFIANQGMYKSIYIKNRI